MLGLAVPSPLLWPWIPTLAFSGESFNVSRWFSFHIPSSCVLVGSVPMSHLARRVEELLWEDFPHQLSRSWMANSPVRVARVRWAMGSLVKLQSAMINVDHPWSFRGIYSLVHWDTLPWIWANSQQIFPQGFPFLISLCSAVKISVSSSDSGWDQPS